MPQSNSVIGCSSSDTTLLKNIRRSKSLASILNGVANIKAAENLEDHQLYKDSLHYYIKGLDVISHHFIKETLKKTHLIFDTNAKFNLVKDFIHCYYLKAQDVDKRLNEETRLAKVDDILKKLREELTRRKQSVFTVIQQTFDDQNDPCGIEFMGYEAVKEHLYVLMQAIFKKTTSIYLNRKVVKCKPVLIYSAPGMGKRTFVNQLFKTYSVKYQAKLKMNLIQIDFKALCVDSEIKHDDFFRNILHTIKMSKQTNFIVLDNLEFIVNFSEELSLEVIESFLCELDSINGYETIIIGLTSIPWYLPSYLRCRFHKIFLINPLSVEQMQIFITKKVQTKYQVLHSLFNILETDSFNFYLQSALHFHLCTHKIIEIILDNFMKAFQENLDSLFKQNKDEVVNPVLLRIKSNEKVELSSIQKHVKPDSFNWGLFSIMMKEKIQNVVKINKMPKDLQDKYVNFSENFENEIEIYSQL